MTDDQNPSRPLTDKGRSDAEKLGKFLRKNGIVLEEIWHSGKTRAKETAQLCADQFPEPPPVVEKHGMAPNDGTGPFLDQIEAGVLIVGHMPFVMKLVSRTLTGHAKAGLVKFSNCRCVALMQDGHHWRAEWIWDPDLMG